MSAGEGSDRRVGWELPGYRIGNVLGRGGFATVYQAEQLSLGRQVAVKVLLADLGADVDRIRFDRERQILSRLGEHPCVVDVYDAGITPERRPFIVMRLYRRGTLGEQLARQGALAPAEVVGAVQRLAAALDAAHAEGVLHRDVKPENVLLTDAGEPVLSDFGIASLLEGGTTGAENKPAATSLTVAHAAPEVLEHHQFSVASDVYALASTAYELLAGRTPFGDGGPRTLARILDEPLPPIDRPDVPAPVEAVIRQAMAKRPEERPRSAGAFARALTTAANGAPAAPRTSPAPERRPLPVALVAGLAVIALVAVGIGVAVWRTFGGPATTASPPPSASQPGAAPGAAGTPSAGGADPSEPGTGGAPSGAAEGDSLAPIRTMTSRLLGKSIAFNPKTGQVASAQIQGTVQVWDPRSGRLLQSLASEKLAFTEKVAYSRDGSLLAGTGWRARIWNTDGKHAPRPLTSGADGTSTLEDAAFSADGRRLIIYPRVGGRLQIWDVTTGTLIGSIDVGAQIFDLAVTPDGRTVLAMTASRIAVIEFAGSWSPTAATTRWISIGPPRDDYEGGLAISPDGKTVASSTSDGYVAFWDVATGTSTGRIDGETVGFYGTAVRMAFSPDGKTLATAHNSTALLWDVASRTLKTRLDTNRHDVDDLAFSADGTLLATVGPAGTSSSEGSLVSVWSLR